MSDASPLDDRSSLRTLWTLITFIWNPIRVAVALGGGSARGSPYTYTAAINDRLSETNTGTVLCGVEPGADPTVISVIGRAVGLWISTLIDKILGGVTSDYADLVIS